jgi:hypothetical protein
MVGDRWTAAAEARRRSAGRICSRAAVARRNFVYSDRAPHDSRGAQGAQGHGFRKASAAGERDMGGLLRASRVTKLHAERRVRSALESRRAHHRGKLRWAAR